MRIQIAAAALSIALLSPATAMAQTGISVGPSAGTDGIGADVFYKFNPVLAARGGFRYADFNVSHDFEDVRYDLDFGFTSGVAALDIHPFANGFRVSGGAYVSAHKVDLGATPSRPVEIGDRTYTPQEVGTLTGQSDWNNLAPFLGIGFNNSQNAVKRFGFQAMLGAAYIGEPDVVLAASGGLLASDPTFQDDIDEEAQKIENDLDDFPFQPILNVGFTVRF